MFSSQPQRASLGGRLSGEGFRPATSDSMSKPITCPASGHTFQEIQSMAAKFMKKWNNKKWNTKTWNSKTWNTSNWNTGTWSKTTTKSPYATAFVNGVKNGMPCGMVVSAISRKTGKSTTAIFKSLTKAGWCKCQKVNGQWIYWPTIKTRTNKTNATTCKVMMWQNFADWCMASGTCTPTTFNTKSTSTKAF